MCRMIAYLGAPAPLSSIVFDPPHSLESQAYRPREMTYGMVNVDGTGIAWWTEPHLMPLRYITESTPWADANLAHLAPRLTGTAMLGAVRSATPGIPFGPGNVQPYTRDRLAGTHNGRIDGFRGPAGRKLLDRLPDDLFAALDVMNDSLALFLTIYGHYRDSSDIGDALRAGLGDVAEVVDAAGVTAALNVIYGDGEHFVATRHSIGQPLNSLYTRRDRRGALIASEPLDDDPGWEPVPDHALVTVTAAATTIEPL